MMFKRKEKPALVEPEPFVPKYYVYVMYGDSRAVQSQYFDTEEAAQVERQNIAHEAEAQDWVDVGTTMVRSGSIHSITISKTMPWIPMRTIW
jgi:hypothetical protein